MLENSGHDDTLDTGNALGRQLVRFPGLFQLRSRRCAETCSPSPEVEEA